MIVNPVRRIFLSHTSELATFPGHQSFVDAAQSAVTRAGDVVVEMKYFGPRETTPAETCVQEVARADAYVAIVGFRYGAPVRGRSEFSHTELEFEAALEHGKPRLVFLIAESVQGTLDVLVDPEYADRQRNFRNRLQRDHTVAIVATPAELETQLVQALLRQRLDRYGDLPLERLKVFISYIGADGTWAGWIKRVLEFAGYEVTPQGWRFLAGEDLAIRAADTYEGSDCILLLISTAFVTSPYSSEDWMTQLAHTVQDPNRIVPLQLEACEVPIFLPGHPVLDISDMEPVEAALRLVRDLGRRGFVTPSGLQSADISLVAQDYPGTGPDVSNLLPRNPNFTDRLAILESVCEALKSGLDGGGLATCSLSGIGGIGKTQVANEFAHKWKSRYRVIWWVSAENSVSISEALVSLARRLKIVELADQQEIIRQMWVELGRRGRWLLIFDNAENQADLGKFWPAVGSGSVLITSQSPSWGGFTDAVFSVPVFSAQAAETFLRKRSKAAEEPAVKTVAEKLEYFPLALEQAGAYVEKTGTSIEAYDTLLEKNRTRLLELGWPDWYDRTLATTWTVSIQRACEIHALARDLLAIIAFLAPDDIPRRLLTANADVLTDQLRPMAVDEIEFDRVLASLLRFSLVSADATRIMMHRLVRDLLRDQFTVDERMLYQSSAIKLAAAAFPDSPTDVSTWQTCGRLLPHVLACTETVDHLLPTLSAEIGNLLHAAGRYLHTRGEYRNALVFFERALEAYRRLTATSRIEEAATLISLGRVHYHLANLEKAQEVTECSLEIFRVAHGVGSQEVLGAMFHLSRVLRERGELAEAERVAREALGAIEEADDMNSATLAAGLHVLGDSLWRQGKLEESLAAFRKALRTRQMLPGVLRTDLAASHKHIGIICLELDRLGDARDELEQARLLFLQEYDDTDHPDVLDVDGHLAEVFRRLGLLEHALELADRVREVRKERLDDHPDVAGILLKYGAIQRDLQNWGESVDALVESVRIFKLRMGEQHFYVAEARMSLARSVRGRDDVARARKELEKALEIFESACGPDHSSTLQARRLLEEWRSAG